MRREGRGGSVRALGIRKGWGIGVEKVESSEEAVRIIAGRWQMARG